MYGFVWMRSLSGVLVTGALSVWWLVMEHLITVTPHYFPYPYIILWTGSAELQEKCATDGPCCSYCDSVLWNVTVTGKQCAPKRTSSKRNAAIFNALVHLLLLECIHGNPFREIIDVQECWKESQSHYFQPPPQENDEQSESEFEFHCVQRHVEGQVIYWWEKWSMIFSFYLDPMFTSFRLWNRLLKVEL